jgi:hypothetical protein
MKIQKLTITQNELNEAVHVYLTGLGVSLPIEDVDKEYSYHTIYTVTFKDPDEKPMPAYAPMPQVAPVPTALASIESNAETAVESKEPL